MPYDPGESPIRERILVNIEETLAAIAPPSYATEIKFVRRWNGNSKQVPETPCALIVPLPEKTDDSIASLLTHFMEVGVVFAIRSSTWPEAMNKLLADARVALLEDPSRGGVAVDTQITDENTVDNAPKSEIGEARMILLIHYRTTYEDPNTAH